MSENATNRAAASNAAAAAAQPAPAPAPVQPAQPVKARRASIWRRSPSLLIGTVIVVFTCIVAAFPSLFTSASPTDLNFGAMHLAPSLEHPFGTDNLGMDIFARTVYATRLDLLIGVGSAGLPFVLGSLLGLVCGYYGGKLDAIVMRVLDVFVAFPFMVLAIAIVAILGNGIANLLIAMWLVSWPPYTRLVRAEVLIAKNFEYAQAARTLGYSDATIMFRHLLPNVISSSVVYFASDIVMCITTAASLSYLGLGVPPQTAEWGSIIAGGKSFITTDWWITVCPGLFMVFVGLGFSLFGDGLNDLLRTKD